MPRIILKLFGEITKETFKFIVKELWSGVFKTEKKLAITNIEYIMQIILACNGSIGVNCNIQCSVNCINQTCDRFTGSCLYGCMKGYRCVDGIFFQFL